MGRIRTLKPEFPQSESLGSVSRDARLLFVNLMTIVDDSGRARGASRMLASLLFPYDDDAPGLIEGWLRELERVDCVLRYKIDGSTYLQITNWLKHQKIDKPTASKIPEFNEASRIVASPREEATTDLGPRTKDQGSVSVASQPRPTRVGRSRRPAASSDSKQNGFEAWYRQYPRHEGRGNAEKAWPKALLAAGGEQALLAALTAQLPKLLMQDRQFVPLPASWLNGKRWLDEVQSDAELPLNGHASAANGRDPCFDIPGVVWSADNDSDAREPGKIRPEVNGYWLDGVWPKVAGAARINLGQWRGDLSPLVGWLAADIDPERIQDAVRRVASRSGYQPPRSLAYFDAAVREERE